MLFLVMSYNNKLERKVILYKVNERSTFNILMIRSHYRRLINLSTQRVIKSYKLNHKTQQTKQNITEQHRR